jgi:hypothetical protein
MSITERALDISSFDRNRSEFMFTLKPPGKMLFDARPKTVLEAIL